MRNTENKHTRSFDGHTLEFILVVILALALALLIFFLPENSEYEHYDVTGTLESYSENGGRGGTSYEFKLAGDDGVYFLDNIVSKDLAGDPFNKGNTLRLKVAYKDGDGRLNVSYISCDGKVYLTTDDYENAHKDNYTVKHILAYVFFGLSGLCAILAVICAIKSRKSKQ